MSDDLGVTVGVEDIQGFTSSMGQATDAIKRFTDQVNSGFQNASSNAHDAKSAISEFSGQAVDELKKVALEAFALGEMLKTLKEALAFSDQMRDTQASVSLLASSVDSGAAVFAKFQKAADETRSTTLQLASAWRDALPAALRRGISDETLSNVTVQLAKLAPLLGQSLDSVMQQWEQIMAGRVRKTSMLANLLLGGSGYTIEDLTKGGKTDEVFQAMFQNMDQLASKGDELGLSLESAGAKIKDKFFEAFAEGFNGTGAAAKDLYRDMLAAFTDPRVLEGIRSIGEAAKLLLPIFAQLATAASSIVAGLPKAIGEQIGEKGFLGFAGDIGKSGLMAATGNYTTMSEGAQPTAAAIQKTGGKFLPGASFDDLNKSAEQFLGTLDRVDTHVAGSAGHLNDFAKDTGETLMAMADQVTKAGDEIDKSFRIPSDNPLVNQLQAVDDKAQAMRDHFLAIANQMTATGIPAAREYANWMKMLADSVTEQADAQKQAIADNALAKYWKDADEALQGYRDKIDSLKTRGVDQINALPFAPAGASQGFQDVVSQGAAIAAAILEDPNMVGEKPDSKTLSALSSTVDEAGRDFIKNVTRASEQIGATFQKIGDEFMKQTVGGLSSGLAGLLGGKGLSGFAGGDIGSTLTSAITAGFGALYGISQDSNGQFVDSSGKVLGSNLSQAIGAKRGTGAPGTIGNWDQATNGTANTVATGVDFAQIGLAQYANRGMSDVSSVISGALAGLSVGGWIGAIVGAVVGEVGKLLQPAVGDSYHYGIPGIANGQAAFVGSQNIDANAQKQIVEQVQSEYDKIYSGFNKVLMTLNAATLATFAIGPKIGRFEDGADLGTAASGGYDKELQEWINQGMPAQMAQKFFGPLETAFEKYGFTDSGFKQVFDEVENIDPTKAVDNLQKIATAVVAFAKDSSFFALPTGFGGPTVTAGYTSTASGLGTVLTDNQMTVPEQISKADTEILKLSDNLKNLAGQDRIDAVAQLAQMEDARYQAEVQFIKQIKDTIDQVTKSLEDQKFGFQLQALQKPDGTPDTQAQIDLLKTHLDSIYSQISRETDPTKVAADVQDAQGIISQIVQLGGNSQAFLHWGEQAIAQLETESTKVLNALGNQLDGVNAAFLARFQPSIDGFTHGVTDATTPVINLGDAADHAGDRIRKFADSVDDAADRLAALGDNGHVTTTQSRRATALG